MDEKIKKIICTAVNAVIIAGAIIFIIGIYHLMIKAGLPYQDAPLDLQISYAVNMKVGEVLTGMAAKMLLSSIIIRVILALVWKRYPHG